MLDRHIVSLALGLLLAAGTTGAETAPPSLERVFVGTAYNIFNEEFADDAAFRARIDRDVASMKAAHIGAVLAFPMGQWNVETRELEWGRTDHLVRRLEEAGIGLVPVLLKEEQCRHYLPIWEVREDPALWEAHQSEGPNGRENADLANPTVSAALDRYVEALIGRYRRSPALLLYNVWNEPHYLPESEAEVEQFRSWLGEKYGTLAELRRVWGEDYTEWHQVSPFLNDDWDSSMPGIDWLLFRDAENARILARLRERAHRLDPDHPVVANPVGSLWTNPGGLDRYSVDNWAVAAEVDVAGVSHYPDQWERANGLAYPAPRHAFVFNHVRSAAAAAGRPWILTELQTNARSGMALHGYLDYDDLHVASWLAFSSNCKGILYWKWLPFFRGRQAFGRGLCHATGELAERGRAVRDIGQVLEREGRLLYEAQPLPARAAILLDQVGLLKSLEAGQSRSPRFFMKESYEGTFQALWRAHVPVDVLRMDRPLAARDLEPYRVVYLPFQMAVPPRVATLLASWVRDGGWLVADARTAIMDDRDFGDDTSPGGGLDAVFGVTRLDQVASEGGHTVSVEVGSSLGLAPGVAGSFSGVYFRERWRLGPGARAVATFPDTGEAAIVTRQEGRGQAVLSAVPLGGTHYKDPAGLAGAILAGLAAGAGAESPVRLDADRGGEQVGLQVHRHPDGGVVVYLVNTAAEAVTGVLRVPRSLVPRVGRVRELVEDVDLPFEAGDVEAALRVHLPARRARLLLLDAAPDRR